MDLSIMQSVIPDFTIENFNLFDEIICLKWEMVFDDVLGEEHRNLILEMKSCTDYRIQMECKKVDSFRFRGNGKISGFYVKDMSPMGYETGVKYEVGDYENDEIEFYITDRDQSYVICFNHHDVLYGCGAAKEWVEKLANFKS